MTWIVAGVLAALIVWLGGRFLRGLTRATRATGAAANGAAERLKAFRPEDHDVMRDTAFGRALRRGEKRLADHNRAQPPMSRSDRAHAVAGLCIIAALVALVVWLV